MVAVFNNGKDVEDEGDEEVCSQTPVAKSANGAFSCLTVNKWVIMTNVKD